MESEMLKQLLIVLAVWYITLVPTVQYARADVVIIVTPTDTQRLFPRGKYFFACTTVANLYVYLDTGMIRKGCGSYRMTGARLRSSYEASDGTDYDIYDFMSGFFYNYTFTHTWSN